MRRGIAGVISVAVVALSSCDRVAEPLPSLKDQPGYFRADTSATESQFGPAGLHSDSAKSTPESSFGPSAGASTQFRLAEVAPDRVRETQVLLSQLDAKQGDDNSIRFSLPADILFDFDKATLRADAVEPLRKAQQLIAAYEKAPITIVGNTDAKGDERYNERLSVARARTVAARLANSKDRAFTVEGHGEREPIAPNSLPDGSDDPEGRQRNRRVEIILLPIPGTPKG